MPTTVRAQQSDTVDAICYRVYGFTQQVVEQTLRANPGLADHGPVLAQGTPVHLPDTPEQPQQQDTVKLWD